MFQVIVYRRDDPGEEAASYGPYTAQEAQERAHLAIRARVRAQVAPEAWEGPSPQKGEK